MIKVYSKLYGVPTTNIGNNSDNHPDHGHDHCHQTPKLVIVNNDADRLKLCGKELNTGDYVRVRATGQIWLFDEEHHNNHNHCHGHWDGDWIEYTGPVDSNGDPIIIDPNTPSNPGDGLSKVALSAVFNSSYEVVLNHGLNTHDVVITLYDSSYNVVIADIQLPNSNSVKIITNNPISETLRVVIVG
jgi:hypothetical protein